MLVNSLENKQNPMGKLILLTESGVTAAPSAPPNVGRAAGVHRRAPRVCLVPERAHSSRGGLAATIVISTFFRATLGAPSGGSRCPRADRLYGRSGPGPRAARLMRAVDVTV